MLESFGYQAGPLPAPWEEAVGLGWPAAPVPQVLDGTLVGPGGGADAAPMWRSTVQALSAVATFIDVPSEAWSLDLFLLNNAGTDGYTLQVVSDGAAISFTVLSLPASTVVVPSQSVELVPGDQIGLQLVGGVASVWTQHGDEDWEYAWVKVAEGADPTPALRPLHPGFGVWGPVVIDRFWSKMDGTLPPVLPRSVYDNFGTYDSNPDSDGTIRPDDLGEWWKGPRPPVYEGAYAGGPSSPLRRGGRRVRQDETYRNGAAVMAPYAVWMGNIPASASTFTGGMGDTVCVTYKSNPQMRDKGKWGLYLIKASGQASYGVAIFSGVDPDDDWYTYVWTDGINIEEGVLDPTWGTDDLPAGQITIPRGVKFNDRFCLRVLNDTMLFYRWRPEALTEEDVYGWELLFECPVPLMIDPCYGGLEILWDDGTDWYDDGNGPYAIDVFSGLDDFLISDSLPFSDSDDPEVGPQNSGSGALWNFINDYPGTGLDPVEYPDGGTVVVAWNPNANGGAGEWVVVEIIPGIDLDGVTSITPPPGGEPVGDGVLPPAVAGDTTIVGVTLPPDGVPVEWHVVDPIEWETDGESFFPPGGAPDPGSTPNTYTTPFDYGAALLQVCEEALAETTAGGIDRAYVSPGLPAIDCATLAVSVANLQEAFTSPSTPALATGHRHTYGSVNVLGFVITIMRDCVPVAGPRGQAPTPEELEAAAATVLADVWTIWNRLPQVMAAGDLFEGRCSELFMDSASALATSGMTAGFQINLRAAIGGIPRLSIPAA